MGPARGSSSRPFGFARRACAEPWDLCRLQAARSQATATEIGGAAADSSGGGSASLHLPARQPEQADRGEDGAGHSERRLRTVPVGRPRVPRTRSETPGSPPRLSAFGTGSAGGRSRRPLSRGRLRGPACPVSDPRSEDSIPTGGTLAPQSEKSLQFRLESSPVDIPSRSSARRLTGAAPSFLGDNATVPGGRLRRPPGRMASIPARPKTKSPRLSEESRGDSRSSV